MPRSYVQTARAEAAEQTRREVLDAARAAVLAEGRLDFAVGDIAAAAGVARSTVYAAFGSRTGLLAALADETLHRAGIDAVIAAFRDPEPVVALEASFAASCRMYAAERRMFARLLALAAVDPEAAEPLARSQGDRGYGMADLAGRLAAAGRLRPDVEPGRAADTMWLLTSFWTYDELAARGLSVDEVVGVLLGIVRAVVLAPMA